YVVEHMRRYGFNVCGEQSGHIALSDFTTTGDGLIAALQILAAVVSSGRPVSEVCRRFEPLPQVLKNVRYANGMPLENERVQEAMAAANSRLGRSGGVGVRPSGTEPVIRDMAEDDDEKLITAVVRDIAEAVREASLPAE